ncbi:MAG: hypothetical protein RLZZ369_1611 [Pseudomonadota bacterium]|jgi:putative two-component system response regulator
MLIAIVDDNPVNVTLLKVLARQLPDTETVEFLDSRQGLAWCLANDPDLLLVDYMMPELDGMAFIEAFRAAPGKALTPILMITASNDTEVKFMALEKGANDLLTKPVDRAEFLARTRNMLVLRRNQKDLADRASWLADEVAKATAAIVARERETVLRLARAAEYRDPETGAHLLRMAHYSKLIARELGWSQADQDLILDAAPMHDIGKVGTPDQILLKPGRLDDAEMAIMREHAAIGFEILNGSQSPFLQLAAVIALSHHEKFDGTGYPRQLKGEDIPLVGRIVAVADVFDALTSERPYKKAWEVDRALDFLKENSGSHFDPACVRVFLANLDEALQIKARFQDDAASHAGAEA